MATDRQPKPTKAVVICHNGCRAPGAACDCLQRPPSVVASRTAAERFLWKANREIERFASAPAGLEPALGGREPVTLERLNAFLVRFATAANDSTCRERSEAVDARGSQ